MKHGFLLIALCLSGGLLLGSPERDSCRYAAGFGIEVGRDSDGYYVRTVFPATTDWSTIGRLIRKPDYVAALDWLAREAHVTGYYFGRMGTRDLPEATWRGRTPREAMEAFTTACGLEFVELPEGAWVVGQPWFKERSALVAFARSMDPRPESRLAPEVEEAILREVPIRDGEGNLGVTLVGISYLKFQEKGSDKVLVVGSSLTSGGRNSPKLRAFKFRLVAGRDALVECEWATEDATGRALPEVVEDFDGDGVRDFVFDESGGEARGKTVLCGVDGHCLFRFTGDLLAVEKRTSGPRQVAVQGYLREHDRDSDEEMITILSNADGSLKAVARPTEVQGEKARVEEPAQLLAARLGGDSLVRVYQFSYVPNRRVTGRPTPPAAVESVRIDSATSSAWRWDLSSRGEGNAGVFPARTILTYKSPGYVREEERRRKRSPR